MVYPCKCESKYQDEKYGSGKRVHNPTKKVNGQTIDGIRCTVCGLTRPKPTKQES